MGVRPGPFCVLPRVRALQFSLGGLTPYQHIQKPLEAPEWTWTDSHSAVLSDFSTLQGLQLKVYRVAWWMRHYGARSAKRHQGFTNNPSAAAYNKGRLLKHQRAEDPNFRPTRKYVDAKGRARWHGTKQLKETQLPPQF